MSSQLVWESRVLPLTRSKLITANDKMHWAARSRLTKQLRQWGYLLGREGEGVARLGLTHARVEMEFAYPDRRRRDRSNLASQPDRANESALLKLLDTGDILQRVDAGHAASSRAILVS